MTRFDHVIVVGQQIPLIAMPGGFGDGLVRAGKVRAIGDVPSVRRARRLVEVSPA